MSQEYKVLVSNSPELLARHHAVCDRMADKVRQEFGVDLSKEELAELASVRLAVLSGDEDLLATFDAEIQHHPGVAQVAKEREFVRILADKDDPAHDHIQSEFDMLSPQAKIKRAREIEGAVPKAAEPAELTPEERAAAIKDVSKLRGGMRISEARRRGVA